MTQLKSRFSLFLTIALINLCYTPYALASETYNGVTISENVSASKNAPFFRSYTLSYGAEAIELAHTRTSQYESFTFDNSLTVEMYFTLNSNNEKVLDQSVFTYGGWSATFDGGPITVISGPCHPETGCPPPQLQPDVQDQVQLVGYAFGQMISNDFANALMAATEEIQADGWVGCLGAALAVIGSLLAMGAACSLTPFTGIAAIGCAGAYFLMMAATVTAGCACSNTPEC